MLDYVKRIHCENEHNFIDTQLIPILQNACTGLTGFRLSGIIETVPSDNVWLVTLAVHWSMTNPCMKRNIPSPTMRTGPGFKSAKFDRVQGEAEDSSPSRGLGKTARTLNLVQSELELNYRLKLHLKRMCDLVQRLN